MSTHTLKAYLNDLSQFQNYLLGTFAIEDSEMVKAIHVRSFLVFLNEQKYKERAVQRKISSLKSCFKFLTKNNIIIHNPTIQITVPKAPERLPTFLEQHQSEQLFENVVYPEGFTGLTHELIMEILYQTGVRRAELIALKENDIDYYRNQIIVLGKGNKERAIPIGNHLKNLIKIYKEEKRKMLVLSNDNLLTLDSGKPLYENYVYRVVKKYLNNDITSLQKRSPHVMRHTFATHLTNNGADISAIKELLGHSSLASTQIYTHSNIEHLKKIYQKAHPRATED